MNRYTLKSNSVSGIRVKKSRNNPNAFELYVMCALPLALVFIFNYLPMFGIVIAFKKYNFSDGILKSPWVGFENFEFFLRSNDALKVTSNTLLLNFIFIFIGIIAAVAVAILFYELHNNTLKKMFQTMFITPHFVSWVVAAYMAYAILHPQYGILNNIFAHFGIEPVNWYSMPKAWPAILTIAHIWKGVGMDSVIYYAALMGIDSALFEAARIDGANRIRIIKNIILPSLMPVITIMTILAVGKIFRADFGMFYQLTRDSGDLYSVTDVIDTYIYRTMRTIGDYGISSAVGLLQSVVGFVLVVITNFIAKKNDEETALF